MGVKEGDVAASLELCECAAKVAVGNRWCMGEADYEALPTDLSTDLRAWHVGMLSPGGCLVVKILEGAAASISLCRACFVITKECV